MATFQITGPDGKKYRVSGENAEGALSALQQHLGGQQVRREENPNEGLPYGQPPEGMTFNPATGQMEDLRSEANPNIPKMGRLNSAALGIGQGTGFNLMDEAVAGASALTGGDYDYDLARMREMERRAAEDHPVMYHGGMIGGGLGTGLSVAGLGGSFAANAANSSGSLGRVALGSAADGALFGAASGFGAGEGVEGRAYGAGLGAVGGGAIGGATPYVVAGLQAAVSPFLRPFLSRRDPAAYAARAMNDSLRRSGMTIDDISNALARSQADDQGMFTVADAMGHEGGRQLSTVARTPNDMRQQVVETLTGRQAGQGDRLSTFLADAFDASDTAAQREAALAATRKATADANYGVAREGARAVNLNNAIDEIDRLLGRDPILGDTALSAGPLGPRLTALRDQLQKGGEQLIDFDRVLNIKSDLYQQMQRNPSVANDMRGVYGLLDEALENSSGAYRAANDTFRQQSKAIEAVDTGRRAASGRMRSADTVQQFNRLSPEEQAAFRAGYVDPLIARVENSSISPTTNKARSLMTPKTGEEFPAFSALGKGEQLGNRIAREQQMFETAHAALGGSKTFDNIADASEAAKFDPGILMNLFKGRPIAAALEAAGKLANEAKGLSPEVTSQLASALMSTNPAAARQLVDAGAKTAAENELRRAIVSMIIGEAGGATTGRLGAGRQPLEITVTPRM